MGILKSFDIKRLRPFRKSGANLPQSSAEEEEKIARLDHDLQPEEEAYVRHYVNYADVLLGPEQKSSSETSKNLVEMSRPDKAGESSSTDNGNKAA